MPVEYCEYSGAFAECLSWMRANAKSELARLYGDREELPTLKSDTDLTSKVSDLKIDADLGTPKDAKKAAGKLKKEERKKLLQMVVLKLDKRKGKKQVTVVSGLENYQVELKKASKLFANKFCCGSSIQKNAEGREEIIVQGEFLYEISQLLPKEFPQIPKESIQST